MKKKEKMNHKEKRFYAACAAMQGLLSNKKIFENIAKMNEEIINQANELIIKMAYQAADELLKQENE